MLPAHSGTQLYVFDFATQQTLQSFIIFDRIALHPRNDCAAKQNYPAPANHERNSDSCNEWLSNLLSAHLWTALLLSALDLPHHEMRKSVSIALLYLSFLPTHNLLRADHLQRLNYFRRADRFHCTNRVRRANHLWRADRIWCANNFHFGLKRLSLLLHPKSRFGWTLPDLPLAAIILPHTCPLCSK